MPITGIPLNEDKMCPQHFLWWGPGVPRGTPGRPSGPWGPRGAGLRQEKVGRRAAGASPTPGNTGQPLAVPMGTTLEITFIHSECIFYMQSAAPSTAKDRGRVAGTLTMAGQTGRQLWSTAGSGVPPAGGGPGSSHVTGCHVGWA